MSIASDCNAAAMDRMYRVQRHVYDITRRYYLLGRDQLIRDLRVPPGGTVLEVGCGTGRNLVKVTEAYPTAQVYGFDISAEMLKSAGAAVLRSTGRHRIHLAQADAISFDPMKVFAVSSFDRVFFAYTLSMIPDWEAALNRAAGLLKAGAELHVADFGQCENLPPLASSILFAWLRQFSVTPRRTLVDSAQAVAEAKGMCCRSRSGYRGYSLHLALMPGS